MKLDAINYELGYIFLSVYFIWIAPVIVLHITYYFKDRGILLVIDLFQKKISYQKKKSFIEFSFNDIDRIDQYKTPGLNRKAHGWALWDDYNYTTITLKNKRIILITCFIANELNINIDKEKIFIHKVIFPVLRKPNLNNINAKEEILIPEIYTKKISKKTYNELNDIIKHRSEYHNSFVEAAKRELIKRNAIEDRE